MTCGTLARSETRECRAVSLRCRRFSDVASAVGLASHFPASASKSCRCPTAWARAARLARAQCRHSTGTVQAQSRHSTAQGQYRYRSFRALRTGGMCRVLCAHT
eukprot:2157241-Pyramimonas_sp.AAC.1